jgi:ADP-glucose pyrophosphorylase
MMGADSYNIDELRPNAMPDQPLVGIGGNVVIENAIIDKNARSAKTSACHENRC